MNKQFLSLRIEKLRKELNDEYVKNMGTVKPNPKVIALSQRLDRLINAYIRTCTY